jgi:hypothetical protein
MRKEKFTESQIIYLQDLVINKLAVAYGRLEMDDNKELIKEKIMDAVEALRNLEEEAA